MTSVSGGVAALAAKLALRASVRTAGTKIFMTFLTVFFASVRELPDRLIVDYSPCLAGKIIRPLI
ncbi:hypothetical protein GCM10007905_29430 [Mixta theicola]|nr:hypothetical protein GCM10007905_29430 [Mixta theicola]